MSTSSEKRAHPSAEVARRLSWYVVAVTLLSPDPESGEAAPGQLKTANRFLVYHFLLTPDPEFRGIRCEQEMIRFCWRTF